MEGDLEPRSAPVNIKALSLSALQALSASLGEPAYRGRQIYRWLYGKGATSFAAMTDLPASFRHALAREARFDAVTLEQLRTARDLTAKALFRLASGQCVEAVLIPDLSPDGAARRLTVCVSSQVGCALACSFCATGRMGFKQNLVAGEIVDQVWRLDVIARERWGRRITNVVFMGMGEPLLNYDNVLLSLDALTHPDGLGLARRRITISTVGLARRIRQLALDRPRIPLAVSLHAPTEEKRRHIIPASRASSTGLTALLDALDYYTHTTGRRITFEYCMFDGFNDTVEDAAALAAICARAPSKVNLIMYNAVEGLLFRQTTEERLNAFIRVLVAKGVTVTVRRSRGSDIEAACGQLALPSQ